jgi:hypothetical protein
VQKSNKRTNEGKMILMRLRTLKSLIYTNSKMNSFKSKYSITTYPQKMENKIPGANTLIKCAAHA